MRLTLELLIEDENWTRQKLVSKQYIQKVVKSTLNLAGWIQLPAKVSVCILLTHNDKMQELNHNFLSINKPTNVLAFPLENRNAKILLETNLAKLELGDLAFGYQILQEELMQYNLTFEEHFTHLLIHGTLHTLGFDHQSDLDAQIMYKTEDTILEQFNIKRCIRSA
jgi:probable rRNA maturation factor